MTGPEHYVKAEALLVEAVALVEEHGDKVMTPSRVAAIETAAAQLRQAAQVHATLALAAATAASARVSLATSADAEEWEDAGALAVAS